ncbi:MAG: asparaginase [Phycisphaerales bacterium]|nr:MAG: asparaginase [Phycisphaerales bacterium]
MSDYSRRQFLGAAATAAVAGGVTPALAVQGAPGGTRVPGSAAGMAPSPFAQESAVGVAASRPVVIASGNGLRATEKAMAMLVEGADPLTAVIAGVNIVEEDPKDNSVGYGGIPNEDGVVELDSCVMYGPTHQAGAVAALRNIKTPSRVARLVMERTDHVLLVGEGALRFARAHGFEEVNLLTDEAREIWLRWKERHSDDDDWLSPPEQGNGGAQSKARDILRTYGTINCCAVTAGGDLAGVTTTSGLSYKIPGRVGDSPIIGAGLYVENEVGAAGSTGRGEAVIQICGSHTVVEAMRHGMSPQEACLHACKRIADCTRVDRLRDAKGRPNFDVKFYAVARDGRHGAASIWSGGHYAVFADGRNRHEPIVGLYEHD